MEMFVKLVNSLKLLFFLAKSLYLECLTGFWQSLCIDSTDFTILYKKIFFMKKSDSETESDKMYKDKYLYM